VGSPVSELKKLAPTVVLALVMCGELDLLTRPNRSAAWLNSSREPTMREFHLPATCLNLGDLSESTRAQHRWAGIRVSACRAVSDGGEFHRL
jgi:hypothetical protein